MSRTTIKALWPGEKQEDLIELRNSHGGAPVVWDEMSQRYLGLEPFQYSAHTERLWPLWEDLSIPRHHRAVLAMTYDNAYVSKASYSQASRDVRAFLVDFPAKPGEVNHWAAIAETYESNPECSAIGFHWTSVTGDPFQGRWNEEKDDYDQLDWGCKWDLYAELGKIG